MANGVSEEVLESVNALIRQLNNGEYFNLYPATKSYNVIIDDKTNETLDHRLNQLEEKNSTYDNGMKKLETIDSHAQVNPDMFRTIRFNKNGINPTEKNDTLLVELGDNLTCEVEDKTVRINAILFDILATAQRNGLMSKEDFQKLQNIEENANNYKHPDSGVTAGTYTKVEVDGKGHVVSGTNYIIPISEGGTGAATLDEAKKNLGIPELEILEELDATSKWPLASKTLAKLLDAKADLEHGNHVPDSANAGSGKFLTEGNYWKSLPDGQLGQKGIVQLSNNYEEESEELSATPKAVSLALAAAKSYTEDQIYHLMNDSAGITPTLKEIEDWINNHQDVYEALLVTLANKVDKEDGKGLSTLDFNNSWTAKIDEAYELAQESTEHEKNLINEIQRNGVTLTPTTDTRSVNIIVPTKVSDLENDNNYISAHPSVSEGENTTSETSPSNGGTFTVIDSLVRDSFDHVTGYNIKTVTLPEFPDSSKTDSPLKIKVNGTDAKSFDGSVEQILDLIAGSNMKIELTADGGIKFTPNYSDVTTSESGLMTSKLLEKLNGISEKANNYQLPTAGTNQLGGVKTSSSETDTTYYNPTPIVNGIPYYKKSCIDILDSDPVNPPDGYMWISSSSGVLNIAYEEEE